MPTNSRRRGLTPAIIVVVIALAVAGFFVFRQGKPLLTGSGCQAGTGRKMVLLDPEQASIAATIAGVAHQRAMPRRAVVVAYAAALQESKLHNLSYGDRDSVGVFQQRPSEGWGPAWKLKDPLERMKAFLYKQQIVDASFFEGVEADADELAARIRKGCLEMPDPSPLSMFEHVYDEMTPLIAEQRDEFSTYLAGFEGAHA